MSHGPCCTCPDCGKFYDDCKCGVEEEDEDMNKDATTFEDEKRLLEQHNTDLEEHIIKMENRLKAMRHALRVYTFDTDYMKGYVICNVCGGLWQEGGVELHKDKCMADKEYNDY
jgi:hypothetical protein